MAIEILVRFTFTAPTAWSDVSNHAMHGIMLDSLPSLTQQLEADLNEFDSGEMAFTAKNEDGWWDNFIVTSSWNPYSTSLAHQRKVKILVNSVLRWAGDIDQHSVVFDRKAKTVSFTVLGPLAWLDRISAAGVRRAIPLYHDCGIATAHGLNFLTDSTKNWPTNKFAGHTLYDGTNCFQITGNSATSLSVVGTPNGGAYYIRSMQFDDDFDSGWGYGSPTSFTDGTKNWTVDQWIGYTLIDSSGSNGGSAGTGSNHVITTNTATVLTVTGGTPADGQYRISGGPLTIQGGYTCADLLLAAGDRLRVSTIAETGARRTNWGGMPGAGILGQPHRQDSVVGARTLEKSTWAQAQYARVEQVVEIEFVGPRASRPVLAANELWLKTPLDHGFTLRDGVECLTPYYRDQTVSTLAALLFQAADIVVGTEITYSISVDPAIDLPVPYADFADKTIGEALRELALASNSVLYCTFASPAGVDTITYHFQRRNSVGGLIWPLDSYIAEHSERFAWEHWASQCVARGADDREVRRGMETYGAEVDEVGSDYVSTYAQLKAIVDYRFSYFGARRKVKEVEVLGESKTTPWQIFDRASIAGVNYFVVGIDEPLPAWQHNYPPTVRLTLVAQTGTTLTPGSDTTTSNARPDPPTVTAAPRGGPDAEWNATLVWTGGYPGDVVGAYRTYWPASQARPENGGTLVYLMFNAAGVIVSPDVIPSHLGAGTFPAANSFCVDYCIVTENGDVSEPSARFILP